MEKRDCTVIVPTRCGADLLPLPLAHLEVQTFPSASFEVIVVDYGVDAQPRDLLERYSAGAPVRTRCLTLPNSTAARACNLAARAAEGRWLLFLDEDLLAGPQLVEAHVRAQQLHGDSQVRGRIRMHPQVDPRTLTKRFQVCPSPHPTPAGALDDFGMYNLSVPRAAFQEAGGLDESFDFDGLQDLALAWRLAENGIACVRDEDATAYAWRATRPLEECRRYYHKGYTLHGLFGGNIPTELRERFPLDRTSIQNGLEAVLRPFYRHFCESLAEGSRPFETVFERTLCHDFRRGYHDAITGAPPRFDSRDVSASREGHPGATA